MKKLLLPIFLLSVSILKAQPGSLDISFGDNGTVVTAFGNGYDQPTGLLIQPDQKIVMGGHAYLEPLFKSVLVRVDEQGAFDNSFNDDGITFPDFDYTTLSDPITDLLVQQPDGKLVFGTVTDNLNPEMGLVRFNNDGSVDTDFGINGLATQEVYFDGTSEKAVRLQPDGKILVVGSAPSSASTLAVARFNNDGTPDNTFNGSGSKLYDYKTSEFIIDACILSDGKILLFIGYFDAGARIAVVRILEDGSLDATFGVDGILPVDISPEYESPRSITLLSDGKILLAGVVGSNDHDIFLVKMDTDGVMDNSFGSSGIVIVENGGNIYGEDVVEANDGNILVAGYDDLVATIQGLVLRFLPNGALDTSFGDDGFAEVIADDYRFENIRLQADQQIVVSGWYDTGSNNFEFGVTRLNYFGNTGISDAAINPFINIFPNPSSGSITITTGSKMRSGIIRVVDMFGRNIFEKEIMNASGIQIPAGIISQGIYFVKVIDGEDQYSGKLILERH
ncbi:MAG: T9SS type A sorting domain-containing protein [Chitinophagales bacterium]